MAGDFRADGIAYAERVNAAAELLETGMSTMDAARVLADRFRVSVRQARRYAERAVDGPVALPQDTTVFTVRLPAALAQRIREHAKESGNTISALVTRALTEFLARGTRRGPRR